MSGDVEIRKVALEAAVRHQSKNGWQGPDSVLDLAIQFEHYLLTGELNLADG